MLPSTPAPTAPVLIPAIASRTRKKWIPLAGKIAVLAVLIVGVGVGVNLTQQRQNIFGKAWKGLSTNVDLLNLKQKSADKNVPLSASAEKTRELFKILVGRFPQAQVLDIDLPELNIKGGALMHYESSVNKTFIFIRILNLPLPASGFTRLWLNRNITEFSPASMVEFLSEDGSPTAYSVYMTDGDLSQIWEQLLISYDKNLDSNIPELAVLSLKF